jgi:UDP-N-acetylglucosamine--N-acetylmuramyl-(pentapeptide) pyrophosphoryl-undecaprenol N-acetylglucosamine transferase
VPYAVGNGEQRFNAAGVVAAGGALLVPDGEFTPDTFARVVLPLLADPARVAAMASAAGGDGVRDGAQRMARLARSVLAGTRRVGFRA